MEAIVSMIRFSQHITLEQAKQVVAELKAKGLIDDEQTRKYDDEYGDPVWYIP